MALPIEAMRSLVTRKPLRWLARTAPSTGCASRASTPEPASRPSWVTSATVIGGSSRRACSHCAPPLPRRDPDPRD
jgi:hypothetical protein